MRKTILALTIALIAVHFAGYAVDSLKNTMTAHINRVDTAAGKQ